MLNNLDKYRIILASQSPRRHELLSGLNVEFEVRTKDVDETYPQDLKAEDVPTYLAEKKADAFHDLLDKETIIITADTIVIQNGEILEKPLSVNDAKSMISKLSGNTHTVVTGVCIQSRKKKMLFSDVTEVQFEELSADEIQYYVHRYQPFDKAGSYGVQEWIGYVGIKHLAGSYYNVMGLPVHKVYAALKEY
ncbi:MAG: septum formation protein Maf [Crocinitomix sp.]|nr:septum formation protein Maf [Crocinitomix sp.]